MATVVAFAVEGTWSGEGSAQEPNNCKEDAARWPFTSIPCELYEYDGARAARASDSDAATVKVSEDQAVEEARKANPEGESLEAALVVLWSGNGPRSLVWAVSMSTPDGPYISGGGFMAQERNRLRPSGDTRPLSQEEQLLIGERVDARIAAAKAAITESYHLEFIDPNTGAYLGGAEGVR